jgi:hypothetical protein
MPKGALEDLTTCLHYSDDWGPKDNGVWDDIYDDAKVVAPPSTPSHRLKHGRLEDGYNKRWQAIVNRIPVIRYFGGTRYIFFTSFTSKKHGLILLIKSHVNKKNNKLIYVTYIW